MYYEFYGFTDPPFNITPDPRFLFLTSKHREAFSHLVYGITLRKGFVQITGEVGAGKTTLCRALLGHLGPDCRTALILNPVMTDVQLLQAIVEEFGLTCPKQDRLAYLATLNRFLLDQAAEGTNVVLIIDEAQNLGPTLLEQVRLLSNLETDQHKLLQIVLMGQPELRDMLNKPELRQLRQRITVRYHLPTLSRQETAQYIGHRLQVSGANGRPTFSPRALRAIYRYSDGVPRLVNAVCDKTLLCGYVTGCNHITSSHVRRAVRELEGQFV